MKVDYYSHHASTLFEKYSAMDPGKVHKSWIPFIPTTPGLACDIGAGSGRDANWLAVMGWDVIAVEPTDEFRTLAKPNNHPGVTWLEDSLPDLKKLRMLGNKFSLILLSAVWMHVEQKKRERAFRILTELLAPGGILIISLRHGTDEEENRQRLFHAVSAGELENFANNRALSLLSSITHPDHSGRPHIQWQTMVFQIPDDGTGNLPLLRHIIVNDDKSATYKLGLLRTLIRIADGAAGMVTSVDDATVSVPFGLVGLYWIKLYMPLVLQHRLIQSPSNKPDEQKGLGFAKKEHFYRLHQLSPFDLRIGAVLEPELAAIVIGSINDACASIQQMPARYITYPGQPEQVFECDRKAVRPGSRHWQINKESLLAFGEFRIPRLLWQSMGNFACWLEPAIINEWIRLMMGYDSQYNRSVFDKALQWDESKRDTALVRSRIIKLIADGLPVHCIWTNSKLGNDKYHVDHCFPWSRWFNNDLWNLLPSSIAANSKKGEKLPSAALMQSSKNRLLDWWQEAYMTGPMHARFLMEAEAALPLVNEKNQSLDGIFDGVLYQRAKLKANQQLAEWTFPGSGRGRVNSIC